MIKSKEREEMYGTKFHNYQKIIKVLKEECGEKLTTTNQLIFDFFHAF